MLQPLLEQEALLESFVEEAKAHRKFEDVRTLKRSLREQPQLPSFGVRTDQVGVTEDWHGGSRRQHR